MRFQRVVFILCSFFVGMSLTMPISAQTPCTPGPNTLCLNQDRFQVEVSWSDVDGSGGPAETLGNASEVSGLFNLSADGATAGENPLLVKVLNGCGINDRIWVFAATSGDAAFSMEVTDTLLGVRKTYSNPPGNRPDALADTSSFTTCTPEDRKLPLIPGADASSLLENQYDFASIARQETGVCMPGPSTLCLEDGRFRVTADWQTPDGQTGSGRAAGQTPGGTGVLWFFNDQNWEMLVRVDDRCEADDRFAVFASASTNVGFDLEVTDTFTGVTRTYSNAEGDLAMSVADGDAFATCDAQTPPGATVRFVSDRSVLLSEDRAEAEVEVEVLDAAGQRVVCPSVLWSSGDPGIVSVQAGPCGEAVLRAESFDPASVAVTASFGASQAEGSASIARPGPDTRLVASDLVLAKTGRVRAVLTRTPETEDLLPGEILVSGDQAGLLGRVAGVSVQTDRVVVDLTPVSLPEAFEELRVSARGTEVRRTVVLDGEKGRMLVRDQRGRLLTRRPLDDVECTASGRPVQLELNQATAEADVSFTPEAELEIGFFELERFRLALVETVTFTATTGFLSFDGSVSGEVKCAVDLPTLEIIGIPLSVFTFSPTLTPVLGISASAEFDGPTLDVAGPNVSAAGRATLGFQYEEFGGWEGIHEERWDGEANLTGSIGLDTDVAFGAKTGPYAGVDAGLTAALGRGFLSVDLADFRFAELRAGAELSLGYESPLLPEAPAYEGPRWDLELFDRGALKAEIAGGFLADLLDALDIPAAYDGQLELFNVRAPLAGSPRPETIQETSLAASCTGLPAADAGAGVEMTFLVQGTEAEGTAELWGGPVAEGGPLTLLSSGPYRTEGVLGEAELTWTPEQGSAGTYRFYPRLAVDAVSEINPYGGGEGIFQEVILAEGDGVPVIESIMPNPLEILFREEGAVHVRFRDSDAGVERVVVQDAQDSAFCTNFSSDPVENRGQTEGVAVLTLRCIGSRFHDPVSCIFDLFLQDCQGNMSEPETLEVRCLPHERGLTEPSTAGRSGG